MTIAKDNRARVADVTAECQGECESCVYGCCAGAGHSDSGQQCLDCTPMCSSCVKLASDNPDWAPQLCRLCSELCEVCTAQAGDNGGQRNGECVPACRRCADRCAAAAA